MENESMSNEYHKIQSVFKRDPETNRFILGSYSRTSFDYLKNLAWDGTEKIDGTNVRLNVGQVRGKTDRAQLHGDLIKACIPYLDAALWGEVFDVEGETPSHPDFTLYGEGYGAGIQKGGHYRPDKAFVLFDVSYKHPDVGPVWLDRKNVQDIGDRFGLPVVPLIGSWSLEVWLRDIQEGKYKESILHPGAQNEGVVLRPKVEFRGRMGERVITKLKFVDFQ
jgi:hypothetical protein